MTTVQDALERYGRWRVAMGGASPKTWAGEKWGLLAFTDVMIALNIHDVADLSHDHVASWWEGLELSESTKATRLAQLRSFLRFCTASGWLTGDPSALVRARKVIPELRARLDPAELLALLDAAEEPRDRCVIALASNLALRGGEIRRLRLRDVDLVAETITVTIDKTRQSDVMPITADLADELRAWFDSYLGIAVAAGITRDSFLVPSRYVHPATKQVFYRPDKQLGDPEDSVKTALARIGWDDTTGEGVHTIRRSVARIYFDMIEAAETFDSALLATMTLLHHTRPETTITYIGRDRLSMARDRTLKGKPFLTRLAGERRLRSVK